MTAVLVLFTASAYSDMGGGRPGARGARGGARQAAQPPRQAVNTDNLREILTFGKELELTDKQVEAIKKIRSDSIAEISRRYELIRNAQAELSEMLGQVKPDFDAARKKLREMTEAVLGAQTVSINAYEEALNLLDDGQKAGLAGIRQKLRKEKEDEENAPADAVRGQATGGPAAGPGGN